MTKIAIIGSSALFPGSKTKEEFWQNLVNERDLVTEANATDFGADPSLFFNSDKGIADKCYSLRGGFIRDFEFEADGYELPSEFLKDQDKIYQWTLYVARQALADAGYIDQPEILNSCGLILGNLSFPTSTSHKAVSKLYLPTIEHILQDKLKNPDIQLNYKNRGLDESKLNKYSPSQMACKALGLNGVQYELDAACATSLYAIKLACDELETGRSDLMLAGAISASDQLFIHIGFSIFHAYAPDGKKFAPFDQDSEGLVSSEGAGMLLLKRLEDAIEDGDEILGVINGVGLSNDGHGKYLLSPNPKGQKLAFQRAYHQGQLDPNDTTYIECHATGTPLGDSTELNSIIDFFKKNNKTPLLGSVKSNMGHLLSAAGMSGILKVLLSMQKNIIPPNINLERPIEPNGKDNVQIQMIKHHTPWNDRNKQAGINSFGFGGTNAHLVLSNDVDLNSNHPSRTFPESAKMGIIGMDVHLGNCKKLSEFYAAIFYGKPQFIELPNGRWKGFENDKTLLNDYGFPNRPPKGAYIEDFDIDVLRYKIQPKEAEQLLPQQALMLKVADNAILDAGLKKHQNVAVIIAMETEMAMHQIVARWDLNWQIKEALTAANIFLSPTEENDLIEQCKNGIYQREGKTTPSEFTSFVGNLMASRIAALWDFNGPAFTVSSGADSVNKALRIAQNMITLGQVESVVLGAVDFSGGLESVLLDSGHKRSQPGKVKQSHPLIGEGAGAIVLKNANKIDPKEKIYALINEATAAAAADISYDTVGLIEASFNETKNEQSNINSFENIRSENPIALTAAEDIVGHIKAASGIVKIVKTALCLFHKFIPGLPNTECTKPANFNPKSLYHPAKSKPWILTKGELTRNAIIQGPSPILLSGSAFSNDQDHQFLNHNRPKLLIVSGNSEEALLRNLESLIESSKGLASLKDLSSELFDNYEVEAKYKIVLIGQNKQKLHAEIQYFIKNISISFEHKQELKTPSGSYFTPTPLGQSGKIAFVYPGSATSYLGVGQEIFQMFPSLLSHYEAQFEDLNQYLASKYLYPEHSDINGAKTNIYDDAIAMMSSGVFYSVMFTKILRDFFKINPTMAFGYSMGECSSMYYSLGVWSPKGSKKFAESPVFKNRFTGNLELLAEQWQIDSDEAKARWISLVLIAPREKVESLIKDKEKVFLTFVNTENEVIISGDRSPCFEIAKQLNCPIIQLPFQNIIHHDFCNVERSELLEMHSLKVNKTAGIGFYSSLTGNKLKLDSKAIAENSVSVCCQQVDFPNLINNVYDEGARIFIEVGPNNTCTNWINSNLKDKSHLAISFDQKNKSAFSSLFSMLAQLISHDIRPDLSLLFPNNAIRPSKSFLKKIVPGGESIYNSLGRHFINSKFKTIRNREGKNLALANSTVNSLKNTAHLAKETLLKRKKDTLVILKENNVANPNHSKNSRSNNPKNIMTTENVLAQTTKRLGENGLPLLDFNSKNHITSKEIIFSQEDLEEFAKGSIAKVFGSEYSIIDSYSRRVMLPMHPYLLVSRVTKMNARVGQYVPSTMTTEFDIPYNSWYTTDQQIPSAVCVESGQCDLLLISYLGIDFQNKGELVYRLLDCTLTFVDDLPYEGQTLRYDISINSFVNNGENLLFFFSYRCYVHDRLVLKMDGGCAGFFRDEQLEEGSGVVYSKNEIDARTKTKKKSFTPLLTTEKNQFSKADLKHLIEGNIHLCFEDQSYFANERNPSLRIPPEKILMLDRITSVDLKGGIYGLGLIIAEKDLHPTDWYFPCHFRDDEVLAGSLQAEGGGNLLRFFMLMLGLQRLTKDARFQPVYDVPQKVRCRKQVTPNDTKLIYKLEIKKIELLPNPLVIGDLEIISDGIITVHFENLGLQLREKSDPKYLENIDISPSNIEPVPLLSEKDISTFALGNLSDCFGPDFAIYQDRKVSRQPNTDLQLISRVLSIDGVRGEFSKPSTIIAEYDVPENAWYYSQNSYSTMPYSILMEIALQPCGLLGAYLGSTLQFPNEDLYFRNLDGDGELLSLPKKTDFRNKTIKNKSVLTSSIAHGGNILQRYTFELSIDDQVFYKGNSAFGFFTKEALSAQVGLDKGTHVLPWYQTAGLAEKDYIKINLDSLYGKMKLFVAPPSKPNYKLASDQLNLLDHLIISKSGGEYSQGYIHATKSIKTYDWYFTCHFYQDPVMPGSLGVEAILQAIQVFVLQQDLGKEMKSPKFIQLKNHKTSWKYRGQILLNVREMHLEVHIKSIEKNENEIIIISDAYLWNETMRIYQVTDLALSLFDSP